jgi:hypothetical protein
MVRFFNVDYNGAVWVVALGPEPPWRLLIASPADASALLAELGPATALTLSAAQMEKIRDVTVYPPAPAAS